MPSLCQIASMGCFNPDSSKKTSDILDRKIKDWTRNYKSTIKILLLGSGESGKTTIIKQMKILHIQGFSASEREEKAKEIRTNILESCIILAKQMQSMNIQSKKECNNPSLKYFQSLDENNIADFQFSTEFFDHLKKFWRDAGTNECFNLSKNFPDNARYFLSKLDSVSDPYYIPTDQDILYSRKTTRDIQKIEFEMDIPKKQGGGKQLFHMFDVGGQKGERRKWIQVFDGINSILFIVACNSYDKFLQENPKMNCLQESIDLFRDCWSSRYLQNSAFICFLNKQDLLQKKVESGPSIGDFFPSFNLYKLRRSDEYNRTREFIRDLFVEAKDTAPPPTPRKINLGLLLQEDIYRKDRECYWHYTTATDTNNVNLVFQDVQMFIIQNHLKSLGLT